MIPWAVTGGAVSLVVVLEGARRRIGRARHERAARLGRQMWVAWIPADSWQGLAPLPRVAWLLDLVPVSAELTADSLLLTPPRRYRSIGVGEQRLPLADIRRLDRQELGHRRPGGLVSSRTALSILVTRKRGLSFEIVVETGGDEFLAEARRRASGRGPASR